MTFEGTELRLPWTGRLDAPGLGRGLRSDGPRDDRPRGRRGHPPARPTPTSSAGSWASCVRRPPRPGAIRARSRSRPRPRPTSGRASSGASARAGSRPSSRNHVVDLVNKYPREQLPEALTGYIHDRAGYDYLHHAEVGSSNAAFVGDEVTDRFCVLGEADEHVAKLRELASRGRRPVQPLPHERRRGGPGRGLRSRHHPRPPQRGAGPLTGGAFATRGTWSECAVVLPRGNGRSGPVRSGAAPRSVVRLDGGTPPCATLGQSEDRTRIRRMDDGGTTATAPRPA